MVHQETKKERDEAQEKRVAKYWKEKRALNLVLLNRLNKLKKEA